MGAQLAKDCEAALRFQQLELLLGAYRRNLAQCSFQVSVTVTQPLKKSQVCSAFYLSPYLEAE